MSTAKKIAPSWWRTLEKARLERWAEMIAAPDRMSAVERAQISAFLRRLARTPRAIEAMLTTPKGRGRPSTREHRARTWKVALDYEMTYQRRLGKADAALLEIRKAWKLGRTAVLEAHKTARGQAWKDWAAYERARFVLDHADMNVTDRSRALSLELRKSG